MTTVHLKIWDADGAIHAEATLDNPEAVNQPPTGALIVGSYLGAHMEDVCKDAMAWFQGQVVAPPPAKEEPQLKLILPDRDIDGVPV